MSLMDKLEATKGKSILQEFDAIPTRAEPTWSAER